MVGPETEIAQQQQLLLPTIGVGAEIAPLPALAESLKPTTRPAILFLRRTDRVPSYLSFRRLSRGSRGLRGSSRWHSYRGICGKECREGQCSNPLTHQRSLSPSLSLLARTSLSIFNPSKKQLLTISNTIV